MITFEIHGDLLYLEQVTDDVLALVSQPDDTSVLFNVDDLEDIIEVFKRAQRHFAKKEIDKSWQEALPRWGKAKIPGGEVRWGGER